MLQVQDEKIPLTADKNGVLHIGQTRVTLDCIVGMFEAGASAEEIADEYDSVTLDQVYGVIFYYLRHQGEVKAHLAREEKESEEACERFEARFPNHLREKLLRAKQARDSSGA
jgi:uncharacterized protein (DUF433 family)